MNYNCFFIILAALQVQGLKYQGEFSYSLQQNPEFKNHTITLAYNSEYSKLCYMHQGEDKCSIRDITITKKKIYNTQIVESVYSKIVTKYKLPFVLEFEFLIDGQAKTSIPEYTSYYESDGVITNVFEGETDSQSIDIK